MIVINYSHPLTEMQLTQLDELIGQEEVQLIETSVKYDDEIRFEVQTSMMLESLGLTSEKWQSSSLLLILPGYAPASACILAEIHGRLGYFPSLVRMRRLTHPNPLQFEIAEIINLQGIRDRARSKRWTKRSKHHT
jgi:hypothetical protein